MILLLPLLIVRFMSSEAELDVAIKSLNSLSQYPELYHDFVESGSIETLVQLLAHENTDIALDVVEIIDELTDEGVSAGDDQMGELVEAFIKSQVLELSSQNMERLNEDNDADEIGVYKTLGRPICVTTNVSHI
jgi:beta-catenin-like protein 1